MKTWIGCVFAVCVLVLLAGDVGAQDVLPGVDLFTMPAGGTTCDKHFDSASGGTPLPADFFDPGSDPFDGVIALEGRPLNTNPTNVLGPTDTIVERLAPATLPDECASSATIPI